MAVLDPIKRARAFVSTNVLGAVAGGIGGIMLVRKYSPNKGWLAMTIGVLGGAVGGAMIQSKLKALSGSKKSADAAKK
jgi:outer membrane lipoprotein SlyB